MRYSSKCSRLDWTVGSARTMRRKQCHEIHREAAVTPVTPSSLFSGCSLCYRPRFHCFSSCQERSVIHFVLEDERNLEPRRASGEQEASQSCFTPSSPVCTSTAKEFSLHVGVTKRAARVFSMNNIRYPAIVCSEEQRAHVCSF